MNIWLSCLKGVIAGLVISLVGNIGYIVFLYVSFANIVFYLMAVPSSVAVFFVLKSDSIKHLILSVIVMVIGFLIWELIFNGFGVVNYFYYNKYPNAVEFSLGDGFAMAIIYIFDFIGATIGTIGAFIQTIFNQNKN
ncbi:hypothetical protein [Acetivibrio sp. MSJd-27]|uniref:hypothetical protein n=1 Tax=Acetivibrio sp. MSJd-27 TaxID=2841523 RepID=UPI001C1258F8|nr:hypothetical protein [Acetivibrio sp. MSJd-27]MBU5451376.1 hypothetical protein [Acetivibrio sp. MSJd-27]